MTVKHELLQEGLGLVNAMRYAASPTAYTSTTLAAAVAAVGSTAATIYLEPATWTITSTVTLPATCTLALAAGTVLDLSGGVVLTLGGGFEVADTQRQLFSGTGTVVLPAGFSHPIVPQWWGAQGDGATNDTAAIQACLTAAAAAGGRVVFPPATYRTSKLRIPHGISEVYGDGATLEQLVPTGEGQFELDGTFFSTTPVRHCVIRGFTLNGLTLARRGVFFGGDNSQVTVEGLRIEGLDPAAYPEGIRLYKDVIRCRIIGNVIELPDNTSDGRTSVGIYVVGVLTDQYGGYFANSGVSIFPPNIPYGNFIAHNTISRGTHGIGLSSTVRNIVVGNQLNQNFHRGIILSPQVQSCVIANNIILDCHSSGIHLAYMCHDNLVIGNNITSFAANGEGGIQCYVGSGFNQIISNHIAVTSNYGVYLGSNGGANHVLGNWIGNFTLAGIAVEVDWLDDGTLPAGALYSRPNHVAVFVGGASWTYGDQVYDVIQGNIISGENPGSAACGIYLAQQGTPFVLAGTVVKENTVLSSTLVHQFFIYDSGAMVLNIKAVGNTFGSHFKELFVFPRGRAHFAFRSSNDAIDESYLLLTEGDTTPDVGIGNMFACRNVIPTSMTYFDGGAENQVISIRLDNQTTIVDGDAYIRMKGNLNVVGTSANEIITFRNIAGIWFELSRNF